MTDHAFNAQERAAVYRAIAERRDMRHFAGGEVPPEVLARLLEAAHHAPSVGLMQPWRFLRIRDPQLREAAHALVEAERVRTAEALGERSDEFMRLKVEGIRDCAELLAVALMEGREAHIFGRRTLPEMDMASVACAIQNLWLAARAEGLGVGWVSLFVPEAVAGDWEAAAGYEASLAYARDRSQGRPVRDRGQGTSHDASGSGIHLTGRWPGTRATGAVVLRTGGR